MSQKDVERTLGRLLMDASFRRIFFREPARACLVLGVDLAPHEREALLRVHMIWYVLGRTRGPGVLRRRRSCGRERRVVSGILQGTRCSRS